MDKIADIIGVHSYEIIKLSSGYELALPDLNYIVKALLLLVCAIYFIKGLYSLIRSL